jgi:hypothetical protein
MYIHAGDSGSRNPHRLIDMPERVIARPPGVAVPPQPAKSKQVRQANPLLESLRTGAASVVSRRVNCLTTTPTRDRIGMEAFD